MNLVFLVFPNQLFKNLDELRGKKVILVEEPLFFTYYKFHIKKLILHRASMKFYQDYLTKNDIEVEYYEDDSYINKYKKESIYHYEVFDKLLEEKLDKNFKNKKEVKNPNFLNPDDNNKFMSKFYINRRKELDIFMDGDKPLHGKYSFDSENRKKLPKNIEVPSPITYENDYINEASKYCKKFDTIGEDEIFSYPITFNEANIQLKHFIKDKFENYGTYQDAITKDIVSEYNKSYLFHSNISSSLNIGLIDLHELISEIINADVPFNSKEGFIRQIIGWREFMLKTYTTDGTRMRNSNFFGFKNKMPQKVLECKSGIDILDNTIKNVYKTAYAHHIERLMVLGNLFLLLEIDPKEIHTYFMQNYIDAYDWVMVGNIYGMSQFSDGGSITTKPYICSSNYLIKMSDYSKNEPWCKIVDALYWRFLHEHSHLFKDNPRMKMQISLLNKMDNEKLKTHLDTANNFLNTIYN